jgi:hypothetical protein
MFCWELMKFGYDNEAISLLVNIILSPLEMPQVQPGHFLTDNVSILNLVRLCLCVQLSDTSMSLMV